MRPIVVAVPVWNRPALLQQTLKSWAGVRGVEDAVFHFCIEPGCDEVVDICKGFQFAVAPSSVYVNRERLGHAGQVITSMTRAFEHSDYAITALDDCIVSTDILELHAWHRRNYEEDYSVICLRSGTDVVHIGGPAAVWRTQLIGSLPGFHRDKWNVVAARWSEADDKAWWWWFDHEFGRRYDVLAPAWSRVDGLDTTRTRDMFLPDPPPQDYAEIRDWQERGFDRYIERRSQ